MLSNVIAHYQKVGSAGVTGSTARASKACSCTTTVTPGFFGVTSKPDDDKPVTPVLPTKNEVVPLEVASLLAVTPILPVTPKKSAAQTQSEISATDRQMLMKYLEAIGENDQALIDEYFAECAKSSDILAGQLRHAETVLRRISERLITCKSCDHFQSYYDHGGGAGACNAGVQPFGACWWADARHKCEKYQALEARK